MVTKRPRSLDEPPKHDLRLRLLVFWSGAVLMGLEIAGSRVLAPHFGNSVFVWGSLITVFLAALSVGNYLGGRLADHRPVPIWLSGICMAVAVWIGALSYFASGCCQVLAAQGLGEEFGPLVASMILFLPPSIGMGMVSPFAVRLATQSVTSVGKVSGSLYALSTVGSILGTIATTFILIPTLGVASILRGLGVSLLVAAVAAVPYWRTSTGVSTTMALAILVMLPLRPRADEGQTRPSEQIVADFGTPYHNITVIDDYDLGVRQLRFDRYVESAISLEPPHVSQAAYTHYFHLAWLVQPRIDRALFIGAGGGIGPRTFSVHNPRMHIDVVDIDPAVLRIAREQFFLVESPQLRLVAADGRMFVRRSRDNYDCLVLDAFTIGGRIPFHLTTADFFGLCRQRMSDRGVFVMNINSAIEGPGAAIFHSIYKTLAVEFPRVYAFAYDLGRRSPDESTNIILVATCDDTRLNPADWLDRAAQYRSTSYVGTTMMKRMVEDLIDELPEMPKAPILTDDFAPIETMSF